MSVFQSPDPLPPIPDNLTVPQFILDSHHPIRPVRNNDIPWLIEDATGRKMRYEEIRTRSSGFANALRLKYNIAENEVVCIFSPNHIDYPLAIWAIHRLGATVTPANPTGTSDELAAQLDTTRANLIIVHPDFLNTALAAAHTAGIPTDRIILLAPLPSAHYASLPDLVLYGLSQMSSFVERQLAPGESKTKLAFLCLSSGTTGRPKAVAISHYAVIANVIQMAAYHKTNTLDNSVPLEHQRFLPGDVSTAVLPFFHIYGLVINIHFMLFGGMTLVVIPKFNFIDFLKSIVNYRITHLLIVPPMMVLFAKHPVVKQYDLSHVKGAFSGAAPLSVEVIQQMRTVMPDAQIGQGYGMTETVTVVSMAPIAQKIGKGGAGHLLPGVVAKVVKQDGTLAKVGETGELMVTGPSMALGYFNNEEATKETFTDGWVHTGDEVLFNEEGELVIVDRLKELIKVRGFQVAPAELEGHLLNHPYVSDVCVVPIPDEYSGEVPFAFVVPSADILERTKDGKESTKLKADLVKYVADHKTKYKWLAGGVQFIDAIPKNPSGKLLRRVLRDSIRQQLEAKSKAKAKL